jgi:hypothetical protein
LLNGYFITAVFMNDVEFYTVAGGQYYGLMKAGKLSHFCYG